MAELIVGQNVGRDVVARISEAVGKVSKLFGTFKYFGTDLLLQFSRIASFAIEVTAIIVLFQEWYSPLKC